MLKVSSLTDIGKVRDSNEDSLYASTEAGLFIVSDGVGGHLAGEVASRMAVDHVARYVEGRLITATDMAHLLIDAIRYADMTIYSKSMENGRLKAMGATIVAALVKNGKICVAHVGDSRAYISQGGRLRLLTEDHRVANKYGPRDTLSKESRHGKPVSSHALTRVLGVNNGVEVDIVEFPYTGESVLLCTDGLTDMVDDEELEAIFMKERPLQEICSRLINEAKERGGRDNITVIAFGRSFNLE